jgi:hypothetical protein
MEIEPIDPGSFDYDTYEAYARDLNARCAAFWKSAEGVLVYRRMRAAGIYTYACRDMALSLGIQLGALQRSLAFRGDVPNFIEPWYGVGTIASAFGAEYIWPDNNAPAVRPSFASLDQLLAYEPAPVTSTPIGRHTLGMIEYFLEKTGGRVPMSTTDSQSPLNMVGHLMPLDDFFPGFVEEPEKVRALFDVLADLSVEFNDAQVKLIGEPLVYPGHGFASSSTWSGFGMSDDNAIMISPRHYREVASASVTKTCAPHGGSAFHSCGDWTGWIEAVLAIDGIVMADAAFSPETDPGATENVEAFHRFANTGVVLNARIVGDVSTIIHQVRRLWVPDMKLVVVTYCPTPEEQHAAYEAVHDICR